MGFTFADAIDRWFMDTVHFVFILPLLAKNTFGGLQKNFQLLAGGVKLSLSSLRSKVYFK
jgi:hypothetical protein